MALGLLSVFHTTHTYTCALCAWCFLFVLAWPCLESHILLQECSAFLTMLWPCRFTVKGLTSLAGKLWTSRDDVVAPACWFAQVLSTRFSKAGVSTLARELMPTPSKLRESSFSTVRAAS